MNNKYKLLLLFPIYIYVNVNTTHIDFYKNNLH